MEIINPFKGKFDLTQEQLDIAKACKEFNVVNIEAAAGSSKTSSLVVVSYNLKASSLFLTFSKALVDEARREFPAWVDVRTLHSLAYRYVGKDYQHKLKRPTGAYKNVCGTGKEISKYFKIEPIKVSEDEWITSSYIGHCIKNTLAKFENCWDDNVSKDHIVYSDFKMLEDKHKKLFTKNVQTKLVNSIIKNAKKLWKERVNVNSPVLATHDTYQKVFVLSKPKLDTEVLYVDECQDCSKITVRLIQDQIKYGHCKVISVGDRDQAIYGFRYTKMLTDYIDPEITCRLSHSFRYGQSAADLAMKILDNGKSIVGFDQVNTEITKTFNEDDYNNIAILFRTNACLVDNAIELITDGEKVDIEIDLSDYISLLDSVNALYTGKLDYIKHHEVLAYTDWDEFKEDNDSNGAIKRVIKKVLDGDYWTVKNILKNHTNTGKGRYTLLTAHKSKGRTFDNVMIAEDYPTNYNKDGKWVGLPDEEKRLLYVAVTRARFVVGANSTVVEIMDYDKSGEVFEDVMTNIIAKEGRVVKSIIDWK